MARDTTRRTDVAELHNVVLPCGYVARDTTQRTDVAELHDVVELLPDEMHPEQLLHALSEKLGARPSTSNIRAIFRKFDESKDGTVSYPEFWQGFVMFVFEPSFEVFEVGHR